MLRGSRGSLEGERRGKKGIKQVRVLEQEGNEFSEMSCTLRSLRLFHYRLLQHLRMRNEMITKWNKK